MYHHYQEILHTLKQILKQSILKIFKHCKTPSYFNEHYYNIKCRQKNYLGTVTNVTLPHFHIFIDLETHRKKSGLQVTMACKLLDIPVTHFVKHYRYI